MAKANPWQWDETPANNSEIDGIDISGATGKVKDGDNAIREMMSQIITMEGKGTAVASAATLTLTGPERYFHITGSTGPITDIDFTDAVDGRWAWLIFDSTPTITHNGTTLQLPGGASITAEAGDRALFVQDSSDNVICLSYVRAANSGTFTPTVSFATAGTSSFSYATQTGKWHRSGNLVVGFINLLFTPTIGTGSGNFRINGVPFSPAEATACTIADIGGAYTWPASRTSVVASISAGGSPAITLYGIGSGVSNTAFTASNLTSGSAHALQISFQISV